MLYDAVVRKEGVCGGLGAVVRKEGVCGGLGAVVRKEGVCGGLDASLNRCFGSCLACVVATASSSALSIHATSG